MEEVIGKRELAKAERRRRIVKAARDLIRETGQTDLSMRALSRRAEVSLSTPYNLFGSKRAVVLAVLEDQRDFTKRFARLEAANSIDRIFSAYELAFSYYTSDPDFYRTIWRALLNTTGQEQTGLASAERVKQMRAIWHGMVEAAVSDGFLQEDVQVDAILRTMAHISGGALLSWTMGSLPTSLLTPSVGVSYTLCLRGVATKAGRDLLDRHLETYHQAQDLFLSTASASRLSETL